MQAPCVSSNKSRSPSAAFALSDSQIDRFLRLIVSGRKRSWPLGVARGTDVCKKEPTLSASHARQLLFLFAHLKGVKSFPGPERQTEVPERVSLMNLGRHYIPAPVSGQLEQLPARQLPYCAQGDSYCSCCCAATAASRLIWRLASKPKTTTSRQREGHLGLSRRKVRWACAGHRPSGSTSK